MKIVYASTPDFGIPTLDCLSNLPHHSICGVITQPDRKKGRGQQVLFSPIKTRAIHHNLSVFQPHNKEELCTILGSLEPDLLIVVAYGMIIPKSITDSVICLNAHGSILPRHRGASPIQASLLAGDSETGITIIQMDEKMDHGDVVSVAKFPLDSSIRSGQLHDALSELAATEMKHAVETYRQGPPLLTPQNHALATFCSKLSTEDRRITPSNSAIDIVRKIKAFSPKPGAFIQMDSCRIGLIDATLHHDHVQLLQVKPEGKSVMDYADFCRGYGHVQFDNRFLPSTHSFK